MADTRDTIRDTVRDTVRDTGNAIDRNMPATPDTMTVTMLILGAAALLLFSLYVFGAFSPSTNARAPASTTGQPNTPTP